MRVVLLQFGDTLTCIVGTIQKKITGLIDACRHHRFINENLTLAVRPLWGRITHESILT